MIIQDLRKGNEAHTFDYFPRGTLLIKKTDPNNFFIKTYQTDEGNAVYLDNGEFLYVVNETPCCMVNYQFIIED